MRRFSIGILLLTLLLSACVPTNKSGFGPMKTFMITNTPTQGYLFNEKDECKNPYYPVVDGASWEYEINNIANTQTYSAYHEMSASDQTFSLNVHSNSSDNTYTVAGSCTDDGITLLEVPGISASFQGDGSGSTLSTYNEDGVTLPNDVQVGDDWSQTITVVGKSGAETTLSATLETSYKAIGYEGVATQAGLINALKVEENGTIDMEGTTILNFHGFIWYGQGIGVVRNSVDDTFDAILTTYNIPQP